MAKTMDKLPPEIVSMLQGEKIVSLVTTNAETGAPQLTVVSWVKANQEGTVIKIAVGHKGSTVNNVQKNANVILGTIGPETCYSITGKATISDIVDGTMKYRVITVNVQSVEDVIFYGGKVTAEPEYIKTYDADLAKKLDAEVEDLLA